MIHVLAKRYEEDKHLSLLLLIIADQPLVMFLGF